MIATDHASQAPAPSMIAASRPKHWLLPAALCALLAGSNAPALAVETITLTNGEWRPYMSPDAPHFGVVSRIVSEAFALEGVRVKYVFRPWKRAYIEAQRGEADGTVVWGPGPAGSQREKQFFYSDTVIEGRTVFFYLKRLHFDWKNYDDLVGLKIGGTAGYEYEFEVRKDIKIDRASSDEVGFRKLLAGRFDIFPCDLYGGRAVLKQYFSPAEQQQVAAHAKTYAVTSYHLLMSRANPANVRYIDLFNRGLKRLRDSGKYAAYVAELDTGE
jgi:polar amino acid transport system substrate-binding protein